MKANRKFLNGDDEAVSPVIAVILMVAITVVLAATVYVWVSGFGSQTNAQQKSLSLVSASSLGGPGSGTAAYWKNYTVAQASPDLTYGDLLITVDGVQLTLDTAAVCDSGSFALAADKYIGCLSSTERTSASLVKAGDTIALRTANNPTDKNLVVTDTSSNSVMFKVGVR